VEAVKDPATPAELPVAEPPQDPLEAVVTADQAKPVSGASSQKPALAIIVAVVFFVALCAVAYYAYAKSA
jgi:hypothetical protein